MLGRKDAFVKAEGLPGERTAPPDRRTDRILAPDSRRFRLCL
ncbi:hypothetical protein HMPREF0043_01718 [Actinobaculum sp. oral taxon 183 str. F0552]|nr:hypothetical protein HMPREF0043_01718 [Actinobaculum sp. oral taxon 183 str. F0552]